MIPRDTNIENAIIDFKLPQDEPVFPISTAAKLLNISVHTLRKYEKEGLIIPFKKSSNQRAYSENDIERIRCIRKTINDDKISINGIKTILSMVPCWKITQCNETGEACQAFSAHNMPCWTLKKENNYCTDRNCRECAVYLDFANCGNIKTKIKELTHSIES
jgi:MerR family transcriptional regulator/heat shock protein HspR